MSTTITGSILVIDDNVTICTLLEKFLTKKGFTVKFALTGVGGKDQLQKERFDLVLSDFRLPDTTGEEILIWLKENQPGVQVIIITGYSDVRQAVSLIKLGAFDYVTKPLYPEEILLTINKALTTPANRGAAFQPGETTKATTASSGNNNIQNGIKFGSLPSFVKGTSEGMAKVMHLIDVVAPTNISVIVEGETGAGKEFVAREIHLKSSRRDKPFIAVDCGAIPKDLASSELFGHIKGAFTSAISNRIGHFELANGGTLFLDEIGNLSYEVQIKLLRAIQERIITKVGDTKSIPVDVRIIAATNDNLLSSVKEGGFREDLYHRLNEIKIPLPALRFRKDDIVVFAQHFLNLSNQELGKEVKGFSKEYMDVMMAYPWYGNLRELKNVIKRSVLFATEDRVEISSLAEEILHHNHTDNDISHNNHVVSNNNDPYDLKGASHNAERQTILNTLIKMNYNKTKAAQALNIDRKTLYNKIKQYNIDLN